MKDRCWRTPGEGIPIDGIESKESTRYSDSNYVKCKVCGFPCKRNRMNSCPSCGSENYWRKNKP